MDYRIENLYKSYGQLEVLGGLSMELEQGRVSVLLGPSGCGKTTLLNILSGLDKDYHGSIGQLAGMRSSYVFQEDRLLPWRSAVENVAMVLHEHAEKAQALVLAQKALALVGLSDSASLKPSAMSGGMKRRVALARAFAYPSDMLLLDEPFSSLDIKTRISVMDLFLSLREDDGRTAIVVTHDVREAIYLADRIFTLSDKPAVLKSCTNVSLGRQERAYASATAASLEAQLYQLLLE
ncbi:MAG TPA: ABC transporter ATP-binding protein [Spirochaetales bacterium]|nr:ABC transporter ATP-binding protein [Spirochaetales bacterium]